MTIAAQVNNRTGFIARLTARARALAEAYGEASLRARQQDETRWRRPGLLWPLFARER